ncbi:hypothetical protein EG835_03240 [bacterium]|nr:hypothetical protein [bacterium]
MRTLAEDGTRYLIVEPCIPKSWPGFSVTYRFGGSSYRIAVENPRGVNRGVSFVSLDGVRLDSLRVPLSDDGADHDVIVGLLGS